MAHKASARPALCTPGATVCTRARLNPCCSPCHDVGPWLARRVREVAAYQVPSLAVQNKMCSHVCLQAMSWSGPLAPEGTAPAPRAAHAAGAYLGRYMLLFGGACCGCGRHGLRLRLLLGRCLKPQGRCASLSFTVHEMRWDERGLEWNARGLLDSCY